MTEYDETEQSSLVDVTGWASEILREAASKVPAHDSNSNRYLDRRPNALGDSRHVDWVGDLEPVELRRVRNHEQGVVDPDGPATDSDRADVGRLSEGSFTLNLASGQTFRVVVEEV